MTLASNPSLRLSTVDFALQARPTFADPDELIAFQEQARDWLFNSALPWWADNSWDTAYGGVVEAFDFQGRDAGLPVKRTRVACRQINVFSHAHIMGWSHGLDLAGHCFRHLTENVWSGPKSGFPKVMTRSGDVADPTIDLYDHAFALFGFAWYARATGSRAALDWTYRTIDFIEAKLRHPTGLGFLHQFPDIGPRLQNPHMHLAEACLAAFETTGDNRFRDIARELADLLCDRFVDQQSGALLESFTSDLHPVPGPDGEIVEPGHQFEWSWILNELRPHLNRDVSGVIRQLHNCGERWGVDPLSGAVRNAVTKDGLVLAGGSRTWPNTERLRSALAIANLDRTNAAALVNQIMKVLMGRYLATDIPGLWCDAFDEKGRPRAANVPTSTLYHLFGAFADFVSYDAAR